MNVQIAITQEILQLVARIDEFKGRWQALKAIDRDRLTQLRRTATIESIGSSTRIEGSRMSDAQVETLLANIEIQNFTSRDEQEVAGYAKAMDLVFDSWEYMKLDENHLFQMHTTLLGFSSKDERHRGDYKSLDNHVAAFDSDGKPLGVIFETSSPFDTPAHMHELLEWHRKAFTDGELHPLLRIGIFVVRFLAVHPFQDGNGRLSRILTTMLLLQADYSYVSYSSIERIIEDNKEGYYRALRATQASFKGSKVDWEPWILFFLRTLAKQCELLHKKVADHRILRAKQLSPFSAQVLQLFEQHSHLTNREIVTLSQLNRNTVKKILSELTKDQLLVAEGKGRSVRYRIIRQ